MHLPKMESKLLEMKEISIIEKMDVNDRANILPVLGSGAGGRRRSSTDFVSLSVVMDTDANCCPLR